MNSVKIVSGLKFQPDKNPSQALLEKAISQQWQLMELTPEHHSLEDVFMNIIQQETALSERET